MANKRPFNEIRELQLREQSHKDDVQRISTERRSGQARDARRRARQDVDEDWRTP